MTVNDPPLKSNKLPRVKSGFPSFVLGCILTLSHLLPVSLSAQEYLSTYKRILIKTSGPENYVNTLIKDHKGFLWLGTNRGLFRFDGRNHEEIYLTENHADAPQVNDLAIQNQVLYVATQQGLILFNLNTYQTIPDSTMSAMHEPVFAVVPDPINGIWWLTQNGKLYKWKNGKTQAVRVNLGMLDRKEPLQFYKDKIWVTSQHRGTYVVDTTSLKTSALLTFPNVNTEDWSIRKDEKNNLYLVSNNGLFEVDEFPDGFQTRKLSDGNFFETFRINNLAISLLKKNKLIHHYDENDFRKNITISIGANKPELINHIIYENQKLLIATTEGLVILEYKKNLFENFHSTYDKINNVFDVPRSMVETNQSYLLATYNGIYRYGKENRQLNTFQKIDFSYAMLQKDDAIWITTDGHGLKYWNGKTNAITTAISGENKKYANIKCIASLQDKLLLGSDETLFQYDTKQKVYHEIRVQHPSWKKEHLNVSQITVINDHQFWVSAAPGVVLTDETGRIYMDYGKKIANKSGKQTYAFWVAGDQSIWTGTGDGVYHISKTGEILHHFTTNNGMIGNRVASITPDRNNHLWVGTFTGLSSIDLKTLEINNYTKEDGLPENEFNHSSSMLTSSGEIMLGTMNGFISFNPTKLTRNASAIPALNISKIEVGNSNEESKILNKGDRLQDTVLVNKQFNYARIHLYLNTLDQLQKTEYEYKVDGVHGDWIKLGNSPIVSLDNYSQGEYHLQVRAITGQGSSNIITKQILVIVNEYFYKTNLFYGLVFTMFLSMCMLYLVLFIRRNKKINAVRKLIAQDLHDEVGSYLTGISMNIELLKISPTRENEYSKTIEILGKKALRSLKDSLWSLNSASDNAREFWDRIKTLARETYDPLDIPYSFKQIDGLEKIRLSILEKNYLLLVVKECITNTIKHGDRSGVNLEWLFSEKEHAIVITNGKRNPLNSKDGQGLYNIENRMKKIGGEVLFKNDEDTFTVTLKLNFLK